MPIMRLALSLDGSLLATASEKVRNLPAPFSFFSVTYYFVRCFFSLFLGGCA
jgi:hypothetical protein